MDPVPTLYLDRDGAAPVAAVDVEERAVLELHLDDALAGSGWPV